MDRTHFLDSLPSRRTPVPSKGRMALATWLVLVGCIAVIARAEPAATIDGTELGWKTLTAADFVEVNGGSDTWKWREGELHCTGSPLGVLRTRDSYRNFELMLEWMHLEPGGNSGVFIWTTPDSLDRLARTRKPGLPDGIEIQILDHGYRERFLQRNPQRPDDWFTTHGDVFPVRVKLLPFPPTSPNGTRSFPREERSRGHGQWNHYYIRAINGEVRLWVNGREVSGGSGADPDSGYICLESEGAPIRFRNVRLRVLP